VVATAFSPNGVYLALTLADQSVQLWDLRALREDLASWTSIGKKSDSTADCLKDWPRRPQIYS
jgi:hypothetical protein